MLPTLRSSTRAIKMDDLFEAARVTEQQERATYSLMVSAHPGISACAWSHYLQGSDQMSGKTRGLIALNDRRGCVHGIFSYDVVQSLSSEATLAVSELASVRLPSSALIEALMCFANNLAAELGLRTFALELAPSAIWRQDHLAMKQRGFALDRVTMRGRT